MDQLDAVEELEEEERQTLLHLLTTVPFDSSHTRAVESYLSGLGRPRCSRALLTGLAF